MFREIIRLAARVLAMLILLPSGYGAAGLAGGAVPVNAGWRPPASGVRVYLQSNGVHTGIVMPVDAAGLDWRRFARPGDLPDPRYGGLRWITIGWGDRAFYVDTPTWADVRAGTVARAAIGSERTVLHVEYTTEPAEDEQTRAVTLRPEEYRRLAHYILSSAGRGVVARGYGGNDVFYEGRGHYSAYATCNEWVGRALRAAGVRVGAWTPFPVTVLAWFPPQR